MSNLFFPFSLFHISYYKEFKSEYFGIMANKRKVNLHKSMFAVMNVDMSGLFVGYYYCQSERTNAETNKLNVDENKLLIEKFPNPSDMYIYINGKKKTHTHLQ